MGKRKGLAGRGIMERRGGEEGVRWGLIQALPGRGTLGRGNLEASL